MLTMKIQIKSLLIRSLSKISHRGYDKKWRNMAHFIAFSGFKFLCVNDRSENDLLKSDESAFPPYIINSKMHCHR